MKVFELLIDYDGTTRSKYNYEGLFLSRRGALDHFQSILDRFKKNGHYLASHRIEERTIHER